jgi:hypothetical protein
MKLIDRPRIPTCREQTYNFFFQGEQVIGSECERERKRASVKLGQSPSGAKAFLRPDDDIGLVPYHFHIWVIEDIDWYARTIGISSKRQSACLGVASRQAPNLLVEEGGYVDCTCAQPSSHVFLH